MRKLFLALLAVAVMAVPASASVQNVKVSGSVDSTYIDRRAHDLGESGARAQREQSAFIIKTPKPR